MSNKYANLTGTNLIKDEWDLINEGFDKVEEDIDTFKADVTEVLEEIQQTSSDMVAAEAIRVSNENTRISHENTRVSSESTRVSNENTRQSNEVTRQAQEAVRQALIEAFRVIEEYDPLQPYIPLNKVTFGGNLYENILACAGISPLPSSSSANWLLIAEHGKNGYSSILATTITTTTLNQSHIVHNLEFDPVHDIMVVIDKAYGNELAETDNYTLNSDNLSIDLVNPINSPIGTKYKFRLFKGLNDATLQELVDQAVALKTDLEGLIDDANTAKTDLQTVINNADLVTYVARSEFNTLEGIVEGHTDDIENIESDVSTLQGNVSTANSNISTLQGNVTTINSNISTINGKIGNMSNITESDLVQAINNDRAKFNNLGIVNVKDFGAVGNGTTDDTVAIQNAINSATRSIIFFPKGVYLTGELVLSSGITLTSFTSTDAYYYDSSNAKVSLLAKTGTNYILNVKDCSGFSIFGLTINGNNKASSGICSGGNSGKIIGCRIIQCDTAIGKFNTRYTSTTLIEKCIIMNNNVGIENILDSRITDNFINANATNGIYLGIGADQNIVSLNKIEWNGECGILGYQSGRSVISDNIMDRNGLSGINLGACYHVTISTNIFQRNGVASTDDNGNNHIRLAGSNNININGNTTRKDYKNDDGTGGLYPANSLYAFSNTNVLISGNILTGATTLSINEFTNTNLIKGANLE